jgi:transcriptional regulator with XRE-family HTH domain
MTEKLRKFLAQTNITQRDLAAALSVSEEYLSRILNDKTPVTPSFRGNFADVYGYETAAAVFGNGQPCQEQTT